MKTVVIRCDASAELGIGHLMRCLTLADQLKEKGASVGFICSNLPEVLSQLVKQKGYRCFDINLGEGNWSPKADADYSIELVSTAFSGNVDWAIVDHYQLDYVWERKLRAVAKRLMAIDDLADRKHDCDLLLDQNYYKNMGTRYEGLLPANCLQLIGPNYLLLRDEFIQARGRMRQRDGSVKRILVFFGGSDHTNQTARVIQALILLDLPDIDVDVVVGSANPYQDSVKSMCESPRNFLYHCQINNMAELINSADLAIGAGGSAMWERCYLGLPSITVTFADNQVKATCDLAQTGAIEYIGDVENIDIDTYVRKISDLIEAPELLQNMSKSAISTIDTPKSTVADAICDYPE